MADQAFDPKKSAAPATSKALALSALLGAALPAAPAESALAPANSPSNHTQRVDAIRPALTSAPLAVTAKDGQGPARSLPATAFSGPIFDAARQKGFTLKYEGDNYFLYNASGKELKKLDLAIPPLAKTLLTGLASNETVIGNHIATVLKKELERQGSAPKGAGVDYSSQGLPENIVREAQARKVEIRASLNYPQHYEIYAAGKKLNTFTYGMADPDSIRGKTELAAALCNALSKTAPKGGVVSGEDISIRTFDGPIYIEASSPYYKDFKQAEAKGYGLLIATTGGIITKENKKVASIPITLGIENSAVVEHEIGLGLRKFLSAK